MLSWGVKSKYLLDFINIFDIRDWFYCWVFMEVWEDKMDLC